MTHDPRLEAVAIAIIGKENYDHMLRSENKVMATVPPPPLFVATINDAEHLFAVASGLLAAADAANKESFKKIISTAQPRAAITSPFKFSYRNHRGKTSARTVTPYVVWHGSTEWHPDEQWFLNAFDHEKGADRDFALNDIIGSNSSQWRDIKDAPRDDDGVARAVVFNGEVGSAYLNPLNGLWFWHLTNDRCRPQPTQFVPIPGTDDSPPPSAGLRSLVR